MTSRLTCHSSGRAKSGAPLDSKSLGDREELVMAPRELAIVLLRVSGVISVITGFLHAVGYLPGILRTPNLNTSHSVGLGPVLGGLLAGGTLILISGPLASAIARSTSSSAAERRS